MKDPSMYGWQRVDGSLSPIPFTLDPAPATLMNVNRNVNAKQSATAKENVCVLKRRHTAQTFAHVKKISAQIGHISQYLEHQVDDDDAMPVLIYVMKILILIQIKLILMYK